jgi:hypothetical protein
MYGDGVGVGGGGGVEVEVAVHNSDVTQAVCPPGPSAHCVVIAVEMQLLGNAVVVKVGSGDGETGAVDVLEVEDELDTGHAAFCRGRSFQGRWIKPLGFVCGAHPALVSNH